MENKGFFQDPYALLKSIPGSDKRPTVEDLAAIVETAHELNAKAQELFDEKDYADALPYLLESYERLTEFHYSPLADEVLPIEEYMYWLAWVCYRICFCYVEAKDLISAYYYINLVCGVNGECFMEWINVLVNSRRMYALKMVEAYLEDAEMLDPICDDEEEKKTVINFLERRLGYLLIEYGQLEKARELFTRLLDNPDSCKFAREELDYIDSLENN